MKTVIFTMGTRGDVQPYIYLSRALKKNGHDVKLGFDTDCKTAENAGFKLLEKRMYKDIYDTEERLYCFYSARAI